MATTKTLADRVAIAREIIARPDFSHARWVPSFGAHGLYVHSASSPSGVRLAGGVENDAWGVMGREVLCALSPHAGASING